MKKIMKRVWTFALLVLLSCGAVVSAEEVKQKETIKISYLAPDQNDAQATIIKCVYAAIDDFNAANEDYEIEFTLYNANYDLQTQIVQAESVISNGCDVCFFFACDTDGARSIIQQLMDAGTIVVDMVGCDDYVDFVDCVFYANDEHAMADLLDEWIDKRYEETGEKLEACVMYGLMSQTPQLPRGDRRVEYAENNPDKAEILMTGTANWLTQEAMALTEDWLVAYPQMNTIFAANTDMAIGVAQALKASGVNLDEFILTTVDITETSLQMVENGEVDAVAGLDYNDEVNAMIELGVGLYLGEYTDNTYVMEKFWCIDKDNIEEYRDYSRAWNEKIAQY